MNLDEMTNAVLQEQGFTDIGPVEQSEQGGTLMLAYDITPPEKYDLPQIASRFVGILMVLGYTNVHKQKMSIMDGRLYFTARVCKPRVENGPA